MTLRLSGRSIPFAATATVLVVAFLFGAMSFPNFASWAVLRNLLVDSAFLGVAAAGATFVILSGGIDLSVGAVMAFTSVTVASLIERAGMHPAPAMVGAVVLGTAFGAAQGALIQVFAMPAFLVTLAGMFLARGAAFAVHPQSIGIAHPFVAQTLNDTLAVTLPLGPRGVVLPFAVLVAASVFLVGWYTLRHTPFGRSIYAVGGDAHAAALMGLPVARVRVSVYAVSGFLSSLAGVVFVLYQQSGDPACCKGLELDAIAAVVIGGTLLRGGVGTILGTLCGVLILGLIQTLITFHGDLSSWWTRIVVGALVLVFIALQRLIETMGSHSSRATRP